MRALLDALAELVPAGNDPPQLLRQKLLANVLRPRLRYAPLFGKLSQLFDLADLELAALFEHAAQDEAWAPAPIAGVQLLHLTGGPRVAGADNGLVRLAAGTRFPAHRHLGREKVLVLEGAYRDAQDGRLYVAGDLHEMPEGSQHAYTVMGDGPALLAVSLVGGVDVEGYGALSPSSRGAQR